MRPHRHSGQHIMKRHRLLAFLPVVGPCAACYSPSVGPVAQTTDTSGATSSSDGGPSSADDSAGSSGNGTDVTQTDSAEAPSSSSGEDADSVDSAETTIDATMDGPGSSSSGMPPEPFCGDGSVDPGEECDLGAENSTTSGCGPDCTAAQCGDGNIWSGVEVCDDGVDGNLLAVGACAPDCSRVIEEKIIELSDFISTGDLGANPVATLDGECPIGYAAMFAYSGVREAATESYDGSTGVDWVLQPYTAYVRGDGSLIWITDANPLLGVRDLQPMPLEQSISPQCPQGNVCLQGRVITGLTSSWVTAANDNCENWTDGTESATTRRGSSESATLFLYDAGWTTDCEFNLAGGGATGVYCVEQ